MMRRQVEFQLRLRLAQGQPARIVAAEVLSALQAGKMPFDAVAGFSPVSIR